MAKNSIPRWLTHCTLLSAAGLALLAVPGSARAAVVWTATFETGDLSEWSPGINATNGARMNVEVLGEQVYSGLYAGKITVHPDDTFGEYNQNRVDIQHPSTLTGEGSESWLSGHYMLPEDAKVRNQIGFFESNVSFQNVMDFWVEPKEGGGTTINFGVGFLGDDLLWTADFTAGVWHQVAIHVLWSDDAATGRVDVWFDGTQVITDQAAKTKADGNTLFYQTGLHRVLPEDFTDTIYIDDFIEADSFADAGIMAPMVGGSGGTGGGGAGGGGAGGVNAGGVNAGGVNAGATAGAAGLGGAGGAAGSSGAAGASGGPPIAAAGTSAAAPSAASETGGCSVRPVEHRTSEALSLLALLGLVTIRRRRSAIRTPRADLG